MCSFLDGALIIKAGPFAGTTQTDIAQQQLVQIILVIALLITNALATLMRHGIVYAYLLYVRVDFNQDVPHTNQSLFPKPKQVYTG